MRKLCFIILVFLTFFFSCNVGEDNNNCYPEFITAFWEFGKQIQVEFNEEVQRNVYQVVEGDKLVFYYNHVGAQCDNVIDDEWGEVLVFEIDNSLESFEFFDDEILSTNCYYSQYGAWVPGHQQPVEIGLLKGEKVTGNTWLVSIDVETTPINSEEQIAFIEFEGEFSQ